MRAISRLCPDTSRLTGPAITRIEVSAHAERIAAFGELVRIYKCHAATHRKLTAPFRCVRWNPIHPGDGDVRNGSEHRQVRFGRSPCSRICRETHLESLSLPDYGWVGFYKPSRMGTHFRSLLSHLSKTATAADDGQPVARIPANTHRKLSGALRCSRWL